MEDRDDYPIIPQPENKVKNEFAVREDKVINTLIEVIEDRHFLKELEPGGYWKVKDGMEEEHYALEEVKGLISDCVEKIAYQGKELASLKEVVRELIPIAEHATRSLIFKPHIHNQYDEIIDRAKSDLR